MSGFFSRFATCFNELSDATFNTLIVQGHKQSNKINKEYIELLKDPEFRTTAEVAEILSMSAEDARKALKVGAYAETQPEAQPAKKPAPKKPRTRKPAASSSSSSSSK